MLTDGDLKHPEMALPADIQEGSVDVTQNSQNVPSEGPWPTFTTAVSSVGGPLLETSLQMRLNSLWQQHFASVQVLQPTMQSKALS